MKKICTLIFTAILLISASEQIFAQTVIYTQNFDSSPSLPSGWYASTNSWGIDTTGGNASTGYTGSTGLNNIVVKDTTARLGNDSLISEVISTVGYANITVDWGGRISKHFADSGSTLNLYWSANGSAWANVSYTENTTNNWALENGTIPVALPAGAANQSSLKLMWVADIHFTPSGTYRLDDISVAGTSTVGINEVNNSQSFAHIYSANTSINVSLDQAPEESMTVAVFDLTGRQVSETTMASQSLTIDAKNFSKGLYIVKASDSNRSSIAKVVVK